MSPAEFEEGRMLPLPSMEMPFLYLQSLNGTINEIGNTNPNGNIVNDSKLTGMPRANSPNSSISFIHPTSNSNKVFSSLRERFNFASAACAALVLYSSSGIKSPSAILNPNKDAYMLVPCANYKNGSFSRWIRNLIFRIDGDDTLAFHNSTVVIELCSEIRMDTIVLSNEEYFSSSFKKIRVFGANRYNLGSSDWKFITELEAFPVKGPQVFRLEPCSSSFVKYVKLEFESFYGYEYYSPLTFLAIYGTTMIDDLKQEIAKNPIPSPAQSNYTNTSLVIDGKYTEVEKNTITPSKSRYNYKCALKNHNGNILFESINLSQKVRCLSRTFANTPSALVSSSTSVTKIHTLDINDGNNIFKVIIDRIGFLENRSDILSTQLSASMLEITQLRQALETVQKIDPNATSISDHFTETATALYPHGVLSNLYGMVGFGNFDRFNFVYPKNEDNEGGPSSLVILFITILVLMVVYWGMYRWIFGTKKKPAFESISSNTLLISDLNTELPFTRSNSVIEQPSPTFDDYSLIPSSFTNTTTSSPSFDDTTTVQPVHSPNVILDSEELLFPSVDPSLTNSSLLDNCLLFSNVNKGINRTNSFLLWRDTHQSSGSLSPSVPSIFSNGKVIQRNQAYCKRSKSMPPRAY